MNSINLTGRITKEIELKTTASGIPYIRFTLAVPRVGVKEGEKKADFIRCIAWKKTAELMIKYCSKGSQIGVNGKLTESTIESNGESKTFYDVNVNSIDLLGGKTESKPQSTAPVAPQMDNTPAAAPEDDYGLPFPLEDA